VPGVEEFDDVDYSGGTAVNRLHYLKDDRQMEIIKEYCQEYDIPLSDRRQARFNVVLGKGPSTSLANVNRARRREGLETIDEALEEV